MDDTKREPPKTPQVKNDCCCQRASDKMLLMNDLWNIIRLGSLVTLY